MSIAHANVKAVAVLDELDMRMRRTAARVSMLAREVVTMASSPEGLGPAAALLGGAASVSRHVPELGGVSDELAEAISRAVPAPSTTVEVLSEIVLAYLEHAASGDSRALERAAEWAARLGAEEISSHGLAALALAKAASLTGEERFRDAAARAVDTLNPDESTVTRGSLVAAQAFAAMGGEQMLSRARDIHERSGRGDPDESEPVATAAWIGLSRDLWEAGREARYLDALERSALGRVLFEQTEGGGAVVSRTLDGAPGSIDDERGTPAMAQSFAAVADIVLTNDSAGGIVAGMAANARAVLSVGDDRKMRCTISTQLPVRGWTKWTFEPVKAPRAVPAADSTRRPARRKRMLQAPEEAAGKKANPGPVAFGFRVRVPGWAARAAPMVKIDKQKVSVKRSDGFLRFEVPTDRTTEIEVILEVSPGVTERESSASWACEVALWHGPLMLTASARLNPAENLALPLGLVSKTEDLRLVADIRRRLPVVRAEALGGGKVRAVFFSPLSDVGGLSDGLGGVRPVRCAPFRTWHRWGK